jgi:hypothetical protein
MLMLKMLANVIWYIGVRIMIFAIISAGCFVGFKYFSNVLGYKHGKQFTDKVSEDFVKNQENTKKNVDQIKKKVKYLPVEKILESQIQKQIEKII